MESWEGRFATEFDEAHREALITRTKVAFWTGETGDARGVLRLFRELLPDQERALGADHPDTRRTRERIEALSDRA